ncbi:MAG: cellulase family glycosylhydrolase [bacterium]|nr:cellulase family glycosylhydrolase [bacterium]
MVRVAKGVRRFQAVLLCFIMIGVSILMPSNCTYAKKSSSLTGRELLKLSLNYCDKLDASRYTQESYEAFEAELKIAKTCYQDTKQKDINYRNQRDSLEKVKANLVFHVNEETTNARPFKELSVDDMVADMGAGWNLGNTMDGHTGLVPNETLWQNVKTTKAFIKKLHDQGFNTVRIPTTWGSMIKDDYSIDEKWMSRVQDIVDYCISEDMYCILNVHHDGAEQTGWLRIAADDIDSVYEKYEGVWRTIATKFKDYNEHLIFESMNEVIGDGSYPNAEAHDVQIIMNLNQIFTNVVRSTGSNNDKRWLLVPARYTNIDVTTKKENNFKLPTDTVKDRIFVSVHYYDRELGLSQNMQGTTYTEAAMEGLANQLQKMQDMFTSKGIPVIVGEYGVINKNNSVDRAYFCEGLTRMCKAGKMVACYWDQGWYDKTKIPADYSYTLFDRKTGKDIDPTVTDGLLRGTFGKSNAVNCTDVPKEIKKGTKVIPMTTIQVDHESLEMKAGEEQKVSATVEPADANDIVLWKTDDETVATVYNGLVHAKGIGQTEITACSKHGLVEKKIKVQVVAAEVTKPVTQIKALKEEYSLSKDQGVYLRPTLEPVDTDAVISYRSSDESIATVSSIGKVVAVGSGTAMITIAASSGLTKTVKVVCKGDDGASTMKISLDVYYNDADANYFKEEVGQALSVSEDGQYTLSFDCSKNLSDEAKKAGVKGLNNLTAIYLKDWDVLKGTISKSKCDACDIAYNKIIVDGKELPIIKTETKSALKESGIFDTNDPINGWDGSVTDQVDVDGNHAVNFKGIKNPQKIELTFTLSGLKFTEPETKKEVTIDSIEVYGHSNISLNKLGETIEAAVLLSPKGEKSKVSFVSSDESIAMVDKKTVETNTEGKAGITITGMKVGTTTITAYAANGLRTELKVTVSGDKKDSAAASSGSSSASKTDKVLYVVMGMIGLLLIVGGIRLTVKKKNK